MSVLILAFLIVVQELLHYETVTYYGTMLNTFLPFLDRFI